MGYASWFRLVCLLKRITTPVPVLKQLRQPILAIWGSNERTTPPTESALVFQEAFNQSGNQHYTLQFFPGAGHSLRIDKTPDEQKQLAPGYAEAMTSFSCSILWTLSEKMSELMIFRMW